MIEERSPRGEDTRERIKQAALRLFAEQGIDAVSIRDITRAAGQKNAGSVNYYFRSKEALIGELIADTAAVIEVERNRRVDAMEAAGGPRTLRDVLAILVEMPSGETLGAVGETGNVFLDQVMASHRELLFEAIHIDLDTATRRCLVHLRRLLPDLPPLIMTHRLRLAMLHAFAFLSSRALAERAPAFWPPDWTGAMAHQNLIDTLEGMLAQPPSPETLALLPDER
ncbi:TetR/AcrR family transcriptional regulator [Zavarzinia compransoris]|uniref:TetR/AcrR family transcriptional regulator n=1 Tax=Zavarzinia marina TaxID=2911065 RepID=UPI001F35612F|nr:TetR/AcrR family transcriptional regulator [Zavarzinia marina]MCF4167253.1 TetR/AcrR family transcriptional regulator [Zavarzinia marina]